MPYINTYGFYIGIFHVHPRSGSETAYRWYTDFGADGRGVGLTYGVRHGNDDLLGGGKRDRRRHFPSQVCLRVVPKHAYTLHRHWPGHVAHIINVDGLDLDIVYRSGSLAVISKGYLLDGSGWVKVGRSADPHNDVNLFRVRGRAGIMTEYLKFCYFLIYFIIASVSICVSNE